MNIEAFKKELKEIEKSICTLKTEEQSPIFDGPVDLSSYLNSKIKILWLLKEAYDNDNDGEGGWYLSSLLADNNVYEKFLKTASSKNTWYPIIYTTFGILNNFMLYDNMEFIDKDSTIVSILKNTAFLNINKLAGESKSNDTELRRIFSLNKDILKRQIDLLNPDIIIGGNTLKFYAELLDISNCTESISKRKTKYYFTTNKLYIDAYHPGQIGITRFKNVNEEYIDDIISIARDFFNKSQINKPK